MLRKIIQIDQDLCIGCGLCVHACHEGAIELRNGKATLIRDDYCDGLGDCLPNCPTGAITFTLRDTAAYDHAAVQAHKEQKARADVNQQWPIQARLIAPLAPFLEDADVLIAADCVPYAMRNFRDAFPFTYATIAACPKLDNTDYYERFREIFSLHRPRSITVAMMEVPCCQGLWRAAERFVAELAADGVTVPLSKVVIAISGQPIV